MKSKTKKRVVAVSGGFDPLHVGHIRYIAEAKKLGETLVVILNNDNWLLTKKGFVFMPQRERAELLRAVEGVDRVVITKHISNDPDSSVSRELAQIRPDVFANGGDRKSQRGIPEVVVCKKYGIKMVFQVGRGGKVQSSSWLTNKVASRGSIDVRPWGSMQTFKSASRFWLKTISVAPGRRLSLQKHALRSETWTCIEGEVIAQVAGKAKRLKFGQTISFGPGVVHRLSSEVGGTIVEVAVGSDVRESDIVRFEDDYGRT